jgi:hypothetical protein
MATNNIIPKFAFPIFNFMIYRKVLMKKILFAAVICGLLFTISCNKSGSSAGSWAISGVTYTAATATYSTSDNSLTATNNANSPSSLTFYFPTIPTKSGLYKVVNYTSVPLDSNQMYIRFINDISSYYYFSTGNDNVYAKINISSSGKVSVNVPAVFLESYASPISDSAQLIATITQQ